MIFRCMKKWEDGEVEEWEGRITSLVNYSSHYEMQIHSRSGITVLFGETSSGNFACVPDFEVGCHLADFSDVFYNTERLTAVMNPVDGITVAKALSAIADKLGQK